MDFEHTSKVKDLEQRLRSFMDQHIYPNEALYHEQIEANRWQPVKPPKRWERVECNVSREVFAELAREYGAAVQERGANNDRGASTLAKFDDCVDAATEHERLGFAIRRCQFLDAIARGYCDGEPLPNVRFAHTGRRCREETDMAGCTVPRDFYFDDL